MQKVQIKPVFVKTKNVRNFEVMMDGLMLGAGEGRLGMISSRAGRGKTRTAQWYHVHNGGIYIRAVTVWRTSELEFLRTLCKELGDPTPPKRKGPAFSEALDRMVANPLPVFIDEIEKLPPSFLDLVRDLSDLSTAPFVLIGEEELQAAMRRNRRVWSRTYQRLDFQPIDISDIIIYAKEATGLQLSPKIATMLHQASEGDFRIVRRNMLALVQIVNAKGTTAVDEEMVRIAIKTGLQG